MSASSSYGPVPSVPAGAAAVGPYGAPVDASVANRLASLLGHPSAMPVQSLMAPVAMPMFMGADANSMAMQQQHAMAVHQQQMAAMSMGSGMMLGCFSAMGPGFGMPQMHGHAGFGMPSMPQMPAADPNQTLAALMSSPGPEGVMAASALAANPLGFQMACAGLPGAPPMAGMGSVAPRPPRRNDKGKGKEARVAPTGPLPKLTAEDLAEPMALIRAANKGDQLLCRAILQHDGFIGMNEKDDDGRSTLLVATLRKLPEDLCLLIWRHPNFKAVNEVDRWGNTALISAAAKGFATLCEAVLDREDFSAVNCKDKWGATALHWAADMNLSAVCEKLLTHADFVEANMVAFSFCFENKTALQVAEGRGNSQAAEVIRKHLNHPKEWNTPAARR